ncbi:lytic murein transglycosylase [Mesorhizobium sp. M2D.F.Ca.ET.185.01.1.1]|nr:lytic murein transglycosylase [Mesorhizobium sp. M2D.F.Ca.ET.140.01.1.1]TGP14753.1 lytic murein transglycosylase [Mesorhizobium sp. M2D.F.Ca.ET.233.01.1.1]TGP31628.1 lytic murein transglycosylase [Mesorhizobium sp. M2D.F.Ca.ET.232.01.1.1]TGP48419.1 lytic murein transglycosylase [bacterium M00.F.Ca.ET.230.01.1.1]TGP55894.1 lytic murein transglycosylase [Mesorhizobium sp. M2D.F.Ca.ET.226.01.1.1]TGP68353.1 lytic murein transglycosylase [Mesorhizobium sp. M2D.F.Ca.ET.225.01.1.1]TGP72238.1 lyti
MSAFLRAPLCPAGNLPHKGGDQLPSRPSPISAVASEARPRKLPISPLVGEMSGRTEGGAKELDVASFGGVAPS